MKKLTTIKVWDSTRKDLKILAAALDKTMTETLDIIVKEAKKRRE